jgi:hypothetical protein
MTTPVVEIPLSVADSGCDAATARAALRAIERGSVLHLPSLAFAIERSEIAFLSPAIAVGVKNVSYDAARGKLSGYDTERGPPVAPLVAMMQRFAERAALLARNLLPSYANALITGRTSFRPVEIAERKLSWRKDDTRLHVDSFPATPVQGKRILRVFSNINPEGRNRTWRLGEPFEALAARFVPSIPQPPWGSSALLHWCRLTKTRRSAYDHLMLQLHDRMKADAAYQSSAAQTTRQFRPNTTWILFSDQVSHAAMSGQHALEQTFYLDVDAMGDPSLSPLRVLERLTGTKLA